MSVLSFFGHAVTLPRLHVFFILTDAIRAFLRELRYSCSVVRASEAVIVCCPALLKNQNVSGYPILATLPATAIHFASLCSPVLHCYEVSWSTLNCVILQHLDRLLHCGQAFHLWLPSIWCHFQRILQLSGCICVFRTKVDSCTLRSSWRMLFAGATATNTFSCAVC